MLPALKRKSIYFLMLPSQTPMDFTRIRKHSSTQDSSGIICNRAHVTCVNTRLGCHLEYSLAHRFSSKRETTRSLPAPCCVSIILKHVISLLNLCCRPGRSPPPPLDPHKERCIALFAFRRYKLR